MPVNTGFGPPTFMQIEQPEWDVPTAQSVGGSGEWITVAAFYRALKIQLAQVPIGSFGDRHQLARTDNPGPGRLNAVVDLASALQAIDTVVDQGEGHEPADPHDVSAAGRR